MVQHPAPAITLKYLPSQGPATEQTCFPVEQVCSNESAGARQSGGCCYQVPVAMAHAQAYPGCSLGAYAGASAAQASQADPKSHAEAAAIQRLGQGPGEPGKVPDHSAKLAGPDDPAEPAVETAGPDDPAKVRLSAKLAADSQIGTQTSATAFCTETSATAAGHPAKTGLYAASTSLSAKAAAGSIAGSTSLSADTAAGSIAGSTSLSADRAAGSIAGSTSLSASAKAGHGAAEVSHSATEKEEDVKAMEGERGRAGE
jgi:hypothetical protein